MGLSKKEKEARLQFVRLWVDYMKTHSNKVWSRQQAMLINSQLIGADQNVKRYLDVKTMGRKVRLAQQC
jgi:hypothetical protein